MRRWLRSRVLLSRVGTRCRPVSRSTPKPCVQGGRVWLESTLLMSGQGVGRPRGVGIQTVGRVWRRGRERQLGSQCVQVGWCVRETPSPRYFCPVLDGCSGGDFGAHTYTYPHKLTQTHPQTHPHAHTSARTRTRKRMNGRARDVTTPDHRSAPSSSVNRVSGHRRLLYSDSNERRPTAEEASARPSSAQQLSLPPPPPPSPAPHTGNVYFPPQPPN